MRAFSSQGVPGLAAALRNPHLVEAANVKAGVAELVVDGAARVGKREKDGRTSVGAGDGRPVRSQGGVAAVSRLPEHGPQDLVVVSAGAEASLKVRNGIFVVVRFEKSLSLEWGGRQRHEKEGWWWWPWQLSLKAALDMGACSACALERRL